MLARFDRPQMLAVLVMLAITTMACSTDTPTDPTGSSAASGGSGGGVGGSGGGTSGGSGGVGRLTIKITDSPFSEADAVFVTFSEVSVHRSEGAWEALSFASGTTRTCDLKQLQGVTDVLGVGSLAAE